MVGVVIGWQGVKILVFNDIIILFFIWEYFRDLPLFFSVPRHFMGGSFSTLISNELKIDKYDLFLLRGSTVEKHQKVKCIKWPGAF